MCEIQFVGNMSGKPLNKEDVQNFFTLLHLGAYSNGDAYGLFTNSNYMYRKGISFDKEDTKVIGGLTTNILKDSPTFIVGHNRLATKGSKAHDYNNHPFPTKDWIVCHNGVLQNDTQLKTKYGLEYNEETDSAVIVKLLQHFSDLGNNPEECVKDVAEELMGSFSVFALHQSTGKLFYFKNSATSFSFRIYFFRDGREVLVGSTSEENFGSIYIDNYMIFNVPRFEKFMETEAEDGIIYLIDKKQIREMDTFVQKTTTYKYGSGSSYYQSSYSSDYGTNKDSNTSWKVKGGIYDTDWDAIEKGFVAQSGKDIEAIDENGNIVPPLALANNKVNIAEIAEQMASDMSDQVGKIITPQFDFKNEMLIFTLPDNPVGMSVAATELSEMMDIGFQVWGINKLAVPIKDVLELYE